MIRTLLVTLCVTTTTFTGARAATPMKYGMTMASRVYDAVCWYEALKVFPETHTKQYLQCSGAAKTAVDAVENPDPQNKKFMDFSPENAEGMYGRMLNGSLESLPNADHYVSSCSDYRYKPNADPPADESEAIYNNPDTAPKSYPYKALTHCLMRALREKQGDKAVEAVKAERLISRKNWMQALLDRENEFRARHGAEPLKIIKPLNDAAQEWADVNAKECSSYHIGKSDPRGKYKGKPMGESLAAASFNDDNLIYAYNAADGWYEEIEDYPYPDGYKGGDDALFKKIGHFTQSVWKDTKYVGYGYAYNKDCKPEKGQYTGYIAARYFPAGNEGGGYQKNVAPPQD